MVLEDLPDLQVVLLDLLGGPGRSLLVQPEGGLYRLKLWTKTVGEVIKVKAIMIRLLHFMTLLAERRSQLV